MRKLKKNAIFGFAYSRDLRDLDYERIWQDIWLDPRQRVGAYLHSDGSRRLVFQLNGVYVVVAEPSLAA